MDAKTKAKLRHKRLGSANPNWKGGESKDSNGYITVPAPERGKGGQREYKHRKVTHAKQGIPVHHVNHKRDDNSKGNLKPKRNHPRPSNKYWRKALSDL